MDTSVIVAICGTALGQLTALLVVAFRLGGRLARIEERLNGMISVRELSERCRDCDMKFERREVTDPRGCRPVAFDRTGGA